MFEMFSKRLCLANFCMFMATPLAVMVVVEGYIIILNWQSIQLNEFVWDTSHKTWIEMFWKLVQAQTSEANFMRVIFNHF